MEYGEVKISDEVVGTIAALAAFNVNGVLGISGVQSADKLNKKKLQRGVRVSIDNRAVTVQVYLDVDFGSNIVEVAKNVQQEIKTQIELMTGLNVAQVNVQVQNVRAAKAVAGSKE